MVDSDHEGKPLGMGFPGRQKGLAVGGANKVVPRIRLDGHEFVVVLCFEAGSQLLLVQDFCAGGDGQGVLGNQLVAPANLDSCNFAAYRNGS